MFVVYKRMLDDAAFVLEIGEFKSVYYSDGYAIVHLGEGMLDIKSYLNAQKYTDLINLISKGLERYNLVGLPETWELIPDEQNEPEIEKALGFDRFL